MTKLQGKISAGHPVDVAAGVLFEESTDLRLDGRMPLEFKRHYSTALLDREPGELGQGWSGSLFCSLRVVDKGIEYVDETGAAILFECSLDALREQEPVRLLGSCMELRQQPNGQLVVVSWDTNTFLVTRHLFDLNTTGVMKLRSIESTADQGVDLFYNESDQLIRAAQRREKRALMLEYDAAGRLANLKLQGAGGKVQPVMHYDYDHQGRLASVMDPLGGSEQYHYDDQGRITRIVQKDGAVWSFQFDEEGRCVLATGQDNYDYKSFRYFQNTRTTQVVNSHGETDTYHWLPSGQVWQHTSPRGAHSFTQYDDVGRIVEQVAPNGAVTKDEYDDDGNLAKTVNALGQATTYTHNQRRQITSVTLPNGAMITRRYDARGRIAEVKGPCESQGQFQWSPSGNLTRFINARGEVQRFEYDAYGNAVRTVGFDGAVTTYVHDPFGKLLKRTAPDGTSRFLSYDTMWRLTSTTGPDGRITTFKYDRAGNRVEENSPDGTSRRARYGTCGRLLEVTEPDGMTIRYQWDTEPGRLLSVRMGEDRIYRYEFNADGQLSKEIGYDGRTLTYDRDLAGLVSSVVNGVGEKTEIERDALGQVVKKIAPDGSLKEYEYDELNLMVAAINDCCTVVFQRDELGRVIAEKQDDFVVESSYDGFGTRIGLESSLNHQVKFEYSSAANLKSMEVDGGSRFEFEQDAAGREVRRSRIGSIDMHLSYGVLGDLVEQWVGPTGATPPNEGGAGVSDRLLAHRRYDYSDDGELSRVQDARFGTFDYDYDAVGRLAAVDQDGQTRERFQYDRYGNRSQWRLAGAASRPDETLSVTVGTANQIERQGDVAFQYDSEGRLIRKIERNGTDTEAVWTYRWDGEGFLSAVTCPNGDQWTYHYDALGRRIIKQGPESMIRYHWDGHFIIHEVRDAQSTDTWVYDPNGLSPIATIQNGHCYSCITDQLGTPRELISEDGDVAWAARYLAWGQIDESIESDLRCPIRFPGHWFDEESGLHYNRFRYYSPETGAYLSRDPIRLEGGLLEYGYVPNPFLWIDFFGLDDIGVDSGPQNEAVYVVREGNKPDGDVIYVGITRQEKVSDRQSQHRQDPARKDWVLMPLTDAEGNEIRVRHGVAKGIEQGLIEHYGIQNPGPTQGLKKGPLVNDINSMAPNREARVRKPRMEAGKPMVDEFLENEKSKDKSKRGQCTK